MFARLPKTKSCSPLSKAPKLSKSEILSEFCALAYAGINRINEKNATASSCFTESKISKIVLKDLAVLIRTDYIVNS